MTWERERARRRRGLWGIEFFCLVVEREREREREEEEEEEEEAEEEGVDLKNGRFEYGF